MLFNLLTMDQAVAVLVGAVLILLVVLFVWAASKLRKQKLPGVDAILAALQPMVFQAIIAGERAVIWGFDDLEARIESTDKKNVADSVYNLIPDTLWVGTVPLPSSLVKKLVTRDEFAELVKKTYDGADAWLQKNEQYFRSQVDALKYQLDDGAMMFTSDGDVEEALGS